MAMAASHTTPVADGTEGGGSQLHQIPSAGEMEERKGGGSAFNGAGTFRNEGRARYLITTMYGKVKSLRH